MRNLAFVFVGVSLAAGVACAQGNDPDKVTATGDGMAGPHRSSGSKGWTKHQPGQGCLDGKRIPCHFGSGRDLLESSKYSQWQLYGHCLLYTSPSPRDRQK